MISIPTVIWLILSHIAGDCLTQPYNLSTDKVYKIKVLIWHCIAYGSIVGILNWNFNFGLINFLWHFIVDFGTTNIHKFIRNISLNKFPYDLNLVILTVDQFLHIVGIILIYSWIIK